MLTNFWAENLKGINYWGGMAVVGKILKSKLKKYGLRVCNVFNCFK
jgi:hypothetical protein